MPLEAASAGASTVATVGWVGRLLGSFPDVVNAGGSLPVPIHDVQHHIKTTGPPIASQFRRLEGAKLEAARRKFEVNFPLGLPTSYGAQEGWFLEAVWRF